MGFIVSISLLTIFLIIIFWLWGILPSISASAYKMKNPMWFTLSMWAIALPIIFESKGGFLFYAGAAMMFTGAAAMYKDDDLTDKKKPITSWVHNISAFIIILFGHVHLWVNLELSIVVIATVLASIALIPFKNRILWIEILNAYVILVTLNLTP